MEEFNGRKFAETIFSNEWKCYLTGFGINTTPDEWFYKTISQAYDVFSETDKELLLSFLVKPAHQNLFIKNTIVTKRYIQVYDEVLEPYFLQKLSVFTAREILAKYIAFQKERKEAFSNNNEKKTSISSSHPNTSTISSISSIVDNLPAERRTETYSKDSIIDVTGEGQTINYNDDLLGKSNVLANNSFNNFDENWKLGNKYKKKLELNESEVAWLNKFWDPSNSFLSVEQCCIEVIRLYLNCLKELISRFGSNQNEFYSQVKRFITQNQSRIGRFYSVEQFSEYAENHIYLTFFKRAESEVRNVYNHKRKINDAFNLNELAGSFERRFGVVWNELVVLYKNNILPPDAETELKLNEMSVTRWKLFFDKIATGITNTNFQKCAEKINELAMQNAKNPGLENIYHEASKLFAKQDKLTSVKFYLKYIHADLESDKIDNKQLGKTVQKSLFTTEEQLRHFEAIVNELIKTNDLSSALSNANDIYSKKRKKIQFDQASIEEVKTQHLNTVDKLNELLQDEDDRLNDKLDLGTEEIKLHLTKPIPENHTIDTSSFILGIQLNECQKGLIILFGENNYHLEDAILSSYAKSKKLFKNQLIESINDCCFEELDDILIEDMGDLYSVNEFYYNKILNIC